MDRFIQDGRSSKCLRYAVAIGNDADRSVLERFTQDPNAVSFAEDAKDISSQFKMISMSISTMATAPNSSNSSVVPTPSTALKYDNNPENDDDDDLY